VYGGGQHEAVVWYSSLLFTLILSPLHDVEASKSEERKPKMEKNKTHEAVVWRSSLLLFH
jgi:hypothetical protein